ncbi:hypothetical protein [Parageobacillus thermoglucosidasius]|uniref:hypothetical protein n=1 Tax=Parageobacillus thermoglucosidasius TaxID=1426 RepID=UPI0001D16B77|nr:hypothetical protein [Parageobacillus thermoglucosidasius]AEH48733.1 hypothetical protein Geoth_2845 [Parageobacillus thermoglucosidasius C56-YS93]MBY6269526.1 hypothetical protein [Parageobacillus thermoglucosidasius]MED4904516.1 hypothetical protein [Parageobacillus thermoglucosidasius]MED4912224.1 hypothetical protein [Parageobacillus thermoglucosidasius]MED4943336.1 hypothetical protein [Parageobacillus thermoglucosidasius]
MKSLQDALYNWLTIYVVARARPDDAAAQETAAFFKEILKRDFHVTNVKVKKEAKYIVEYKKDGEEESACFPAELIEAMLKQIEEAPEKYDNYPL